jgi:cytochrome c-type biogenesis protein CcmH
LPQIAAAPAETAPAAAAPAVAAQEARAATATASGEARIAGTVTLSAELRSKVAPEDSVIIFARPAEGSRMPLAMLRLQARELPKTFALDDSMAMSPDFKLSKFEEVIVGARVSKSGNPMPQKGDLEGLSKPVKLGRGDVAVTIDRVLP